MIRRLAAFLLLTTVAGAQTVQRGVTVAPDSVTVGDPFRVVIRIRAPLGSVIEFPASPDTSTRVAPLDSVLITDASDSLTVDQSATYRLAAWDVGARALRFPEVLVRSAGGQEVRRVAVGNDLSVMVVSVLPADSSERVPKPLRPVYEFGLPWWWWLVVAAIAALVGGLLLWWWRRRPARVVPVLDPYTEAVRAFDRIDGLQLVAAGEGGQHVALMTDVLRTYLSRVVPSAKTSLTTHELLHALRTASRVPRSRLQALLHEADLVKFARHRLSEGRAESLGAEARAMVEAIHVVEEASVPAKAA
jgi:hypothetical protein